MFRFVGGLINDAKNRYRYYLSDITDGIHIQCVASTIFLFFACITPIVTFGGRMGQKTNGYMVGNISHQLKLDWPTTEQTCSYIFADR